MKLSEEDGGKVHMVGVVSSEEFANWDQYSLSTPGAWGCQNDATFADGKRLGEGSKGIFTEGGTVTLELDRTKNSLRGVRQQADEEHRRTGIGLALSGSLPSQHRTVRGASRAVAQTDPAPGGAELAVCRPRVSPSHH